MVVRFNAFTTVISESYDSGSSSEVLEVDFMEDDGTTSLCPTIYHPTEMSNRLG